jgi:hypothetical protein
MLFMKNGSDYPIFITPLAACRLQPSPAVAFLDADVDITSHHTGVLGLAQRCSQVSLLRRCTLPSDRLIVDTRDQGAEPEDQPPDLIPARAVDYI